MHEGESLDSDVFLDCCGNCDGLWFDAKELKQTLEIIACESNDESGSATPPVMRHNEKPESKEKRQSRGRSCPKCRERMARKAVICIECGYDERSGLRVKPHASVRTGKSGFVWGFWLIVHVVRYSSLVAFLVFFVVAVGLSSVDGDLAPHASDSPAAAASILMYTPYIAVLWSFVQAVDFRRKKIEIRGKWTEIRSDGDGDDTIDYVVDTDIGMTKVSKRSYRNLGEGCMYRCWSAELGYLPFFGTSLFIGAPFENVTVSEDSIEDYRR
jgi:Zn-finger nucleic acid-binding protein